MKKTIKLAVCYAECIMLIGFCIFQFAPDKVLGIFARINYRDGKPKYLADTPRFIKYVRQTAGRYVELSPLRHLIDELDGVRERAGYTF